MTDWKSRATEILGLHWAGPDAVAAAFTRAALQLGQEMQAETREILLEKISALEVKIQALEELRTKAADARAEEIAQAIEALRGDHGADQRGWVFGLRDAARTARSTVKPKKTREEVLEEALRYMPCSCAHELETDASKHSFWCNRFVARRALEEADRLKPPA